MSGRDVRGHGKSEADAKFEADAQYLASTVRHAQNLWWLAVANVEQSPQLLERVQAILDGSDPE